MSETAAIYETKSGDYLVMAYETKSGDYLVMAFASDGTFCDSATAGNMAEAVDTATVMRPAGGKAIVMRAVSVVYEQTAMQS